MKTELQAKLLTRRDFAKCAAIGVASLSAGAALAGCSSSSSDEDTGSSSSATNQVIVAISTEAEPSAGFDPLIDWGCGGHKHEPLIQSTLVTIDVDMNFGLDLATEYSCSDDGLTWSFTVRDDAYFSDGVQLTAADVAFTVNGIVNGSASAADLSMIDEAVATDDTHVELHLNKPYNALLYTLAMMGVVPEHAYDESYGAAPIGSGRYLMEQWDQGQQVILTANPDYYGTAPTMERVVVVFMEEDAALAAVRAGEVDIAFTASTYSEQTVDGYELLACESKNARGISLPCIASGSTKMDGSAEYAAGNDVTCDVAVRRAMNYAVDRETMIENVLNGYATPAYSVCDDMPWGNDDMQVETDADYAVQLLEEAGWQLGDDGVRECDGVRCAFDLYYSAGDSQRQGLAAEFANQMAEVGIEVNVTGASWDDIYPNEFSSPVLWASGTNSPADLYALNYSEGLSNFPCYENADIDVYLDEALAVPDIEDSYDLWQAAQWDGEVGVAPKGAATWVWLAYPQHLFFKREGLDVGEQKPHHGHGWSLLNNVDTWTWS